MPAIFDNKNSSSPPGAVFHWSAAGAPDAVATGTDSAGVAANAFVSAIFIPVACTLTGLSFLIGGTGGTDKAIAYLWDKDGVLLANSAVAGATVGTLGTMQRLAFTAPVWIPAGLYFVGIQYNGNTATIRTAITGSYPTAAPAITFGTPANITAPTSFTTAQAPIVQTY